MVYDNDYDEKVYYNKSDGIIFMTKVEVRSDENGDNITDENGDYILDTINFELENIVWN